VEEALAARERAAGSGDGAVAAYSPAGNPKTVREYVDVLDDRRRAVLSNQLDRLNLQTDAICPLPFPHSSQIEGELRELPGHWFEKRLARSGLGLRASAVVCTDLHGERRHTRRAPVTRMSARGALRLAGVVAALIAVAGISATAQARAPADPGAGVAATDPAPELTGLAASVLTPRAACGAPMAASTSPMSSCSRTRRTS
jgi:hypothetical protein